MKRNEHLQPLSRQHHNGLLAALLLKKGLARNADITVMATFILDFWKDDLQAHFLDEEQHLLPMATADTFDQQLNDQLLDEHSRLRIIVDRIKTGTYSGDDIAAFANLLETHIRFEERVYFPALEAALDASRLAAAGAHLHDRDEKNCMQYPARFWE